MNLEEFMDEQKRSIDNLIRKYLPKNLDNNYIEWAFGKARHEYDIESISKSLSEPIHDFLERGGKRWRPILFLLLSEALGADVNKVKDFAILPELLHEGSIVIDDIEDDGELRRGKPCTHKLFGIDVAINAGNFMYFLPLLAFIKNKDKFEPNILLRAYEAYSREMINIHIGQATDIWWHKGRKNDITEEQYLQMCANKTGCLSRLAARLAVALSGKSAEEEEKFAKFAENLGIAFQIKDDILSAAGGEFADKKGYGDDITEGKRSLVVIYTLEKASRSDRERLIKILDSHTRDTNLIKEAIEIIKKYRSIDYANELASRLIETSWKEIDPILKESHAKKNLRALAEFSIERKI